MSRKMVLAGLIALIPGLTYAQNVGEDPKRKDTLNTTITFSEYPVGTTITNQYQPLGILFGSGAFITTDGSNPTSPVLSGTPQFNGPITATFVDPSSGKPITVNEFQLNGGYFDTLHSTRLTWYDAAGNVLGSRTNTELGILLVYVKSDVGISGFQTSVVGDEPAGYAMDNVSFNQPQAACGDERDSIIQEYVEFHVQLSPICSNFTQTAHDAYYTFSDFNSGDYSYALIREPLTISSSAGYGFDLWVENIGSIHQLNSGYRNPAHNKVIGGKPGSRHQFGDAVDLKNNSHTIDEYNTLAMAATDAHADFIEDPYGKTGPCKLRCVHADWRAHAGPYVQ